MPPETTTKPAETQEGDKPKETNTTASSARLVQEGNTQARPEAATVNTADTHLPTVTVTDNTSKPDEPKPRALNDETLKQYADELHKAVNRENWRGANDPDKDKIFQLLNSLGEADRKALEQAYLNAPGNKDHRTLRSELERRMDGDDFRKAEAALNTRDGRTNDAGNLMVSLSAINDNRGDAERRVIETFATLNKDQRAKLEEDFKNDYGMTVDEALKRYGMSGDGMKVLGFMNKPIEQRTSQDIQDFARFAVDKKNLDYLSIALRGDTPAAVEARQALQKDEEFTKKLVDAFKPKEEGGFVGFVKGVADIAAGPLDEIVSGIINGDLSVGKVLGGTVIGEAFVATMNAVDAKEENLQLLLALDYLREGRPSLATIAMNNTGSLFGWFDNKDNIKLAVDNATDSERQAFLRGKELVGKDPNTLSEADKGNLAYYERLHKAFEDAGDDRETAVWEAKLLYGKDSLQAKIADTDKKNDRFSAIENMTEEQWNALKDPNKRKEFDQFLSRFVDEGDRKRMMELIDGKAAAPDFARSQEVRRTVTELIQHNTNDGFFSTSYDGKKIVEGLEKMSPAEAQKYKDDPSFRAEIDKFVREKLNNQERNYAQHMLRQVEQTGKPPEQDAVGKILANAATGADSKTQLTAIEELLTQDPELRKRLGGDVNALSPSEKALRQTIDSALTKIIADSPGYQAMLRGGESAAYGASRYLETEQKNLSAAIFENGRLPVDVKADLGLKNRGFYEEAAKVSPEEREKLFKNPNITKEERQLIEKVAEQGGQMKVEDKMRSYILGDGSDPSEFKNELRQMTGEQKQQLKEEYVRKYGSALEDDLLSKIPEKERQAYKNALTPSEVDGRQDYYDNLEEWLKSRSGGGLAPDATGITVERAMTDQAALQQWFNSRFEKMPPEIQDAANAYFKDALEQHKQSKEKMAEILATVAITAAALAATPFTGGASLALVASVAFVAGGVAKIAIHRAVQGGDYDWNKAIGHFVGGGTEGALNFLGGKIVEGMFKGFNVAGNQLAGSLIANKLVSEGSEATVGRAFTKLISQGANASDGALDDFVRTVAPNADDVTKESIRRAAAEAVKQNHDAILNRATNVALATVDNAAVGGAAAAADVVVRATIDGRPLSADEILNAALIGAGTGAIMGGIIRGGIEGKDIYFNAKKGPNGENILVPPPNADKPLVIEGPDGTRRTVTGETEVKPGERIVDGPEPNVSQLSPEAAFEPNGGWFDRFRKGLGERWRNVWNELSPPTQHTYTNPNDAVVSVNGRDYQFKDGKLVVGRQDMSTLTDDSLVSRNHGTLEFKENKFYYTDTSTNGTFRQLPDGTWERLPKDRPVEVGPNDRIRLGSMQGPPLEIFPTNGPSIYDISVNGQTVRSNSFAEGGEIPLGRRHPGLAGEPADVLNNRVSRDHGALRFDAQSNSYVYRDNNSVNGSYIEHADGSWTMIKNGQVYTRPAHPQHGQFTPVAQNDSLYLKPGDRIHLGSEQGPEVRMEQTRGRTLQDGSVLYRKPEGDWIVRQDGSAQFKNNAGDLLSRDANGRMSELRTADGGTFAYQYDANGQPNVIHHQYADGRHVAYAKEGNQWNQFTKDASGNWKKEPYHGQIEVQADGTTKLTPADGTKPTEVRHPDGRTEKLWRDNPRVDYDAADINVERAKLRAAVDKTFGDVGQRDRFLSMQRMIEARGLPPEEVAALYRQVDRLLEGGPNSVLTQAERARLAEQVMHNTAYPHTIDQGPNNTCNVTTIEGRMYHNNPSEAARLITDVALTGKYVTPNGTVVDMGRVGGHRFQPESGPNVMAHQFDASYVGQYPPDVKQDWARNWANQIFQNTAVNVHWAQATGYFDKGGQWVNLKPGETIQYVKRQPTPGVKDDTGERLIVFADNGNAIKEIEIGQAPRLKTAELADVWNHIVPGRTPDGRPITGDQSNFILAGYADGTGRVLAIQDDAHLHSMLDWMTKNDKIPAVVHVDTNKSEVLFGKRDPNAPHGSHVILVTGYDPATGMVQISNQWGSRNNKIVHVSELNKALWR